VDIRQSYLRGSFRQDLFYRLNVFPITIPSLRERPEDIVLLARHFLERRRRMLISPVLGFTPRAESLLLNYNWPGNVRELENVVERLLNIVDEPHIRREHLAFLKVKMGRALMTNQQGALLEGSERQTIIDAMQAIGHNIALASRMLGISRPTLYRKLKKYNLRTGALPPADEC
jgi:transcriptional regulator with PAS, ATPase and Fis domain